MKLEISYKKKTWKNHKHREAQQRATEQPVGHWRNQRDQKYMEANENENTTAKAILFFLLNSYASSIYR